MILRALGWLFALIGFLMLIVYGLAWIWLEPEVPTWAHVVGGGGGLLVGLWLFLDWGSLKDLGKDQTVLRSATAGFAALLALGVAAAGNVVAHKYDKRWDLTETKRYTLSQQSIDIAKALDREVEVMAFFTAGSPEESNFRDLVERYQEHSTLLKAEFHDPFSSPQLAEQLKILSTTGTVIVKAGDNEQRLETSFDEEAFTNALVKVKSDVQHPVCLVTGHGELEREDDQSVSGFGFAATKIEGQNYAVSAISLLQETPTPEKCKVVVVAGPQAELLPGERDRLAQYVAAGGGLIVMLDPLRAPETAADMARYGVKVGNDVVIEGNPYRQLNGEPTYLILDPESYDPHPITSKLQQGASVLALARSVDKAGDVAGLNVQVIARASDDAWGETNLTDATAPAEPTPGADVVGKVPLAVAVEVTDPAAVRTKTEAAPASTDAPVPVATPVETAAPPAKAGGKVVVYGDADFASNQMLGFGVNQDLFLNAVAWMVGEEEQISIRSNEAGKGKLTLDLVSLFLTAIVTLLVAPGLAIAGAVGTWLMRRKL
ncbi:MAG: GldG family protein [Myxococcota bacterium]